MSQTIDEKVVELRFDNKQFESGVKESLSTLSRLKDAITKNNTSTKVLDDLQNKANKIDLSQLSRNVESLSNRFSTLGIVGMRVIENITDGLMGGLSRGISAVTDKIVSGGIRRAMNIENAHFQLQGIISDEQEVIKIMGEASESVDGTAYSYDVAAKAASMFAASGVESGAKMENALRGIAGVAATTNANYEDISQIFTTVAGNGRVMADQLNQLGYRGMNAAAALTKYFNGVNDGSIKASDEVAALVKQVTGGKQIIEADLRDLVSKGKVTFEVFSEAMGTLFGEHAKDANKTFTGSLANIGAALARTGEKFITPLIQQEGPLVHLFNAIRVKINEFNTALGAANGIAGQFTSWVNRIVERITPMIEKFKIANTYTTTLADGTKKVWESADYRIQKWGNHTETLVKQKIYTPFHALVNIVNTVKYAFMGLGSVLKAIGGAFKNVFMQEGWANGFYAGLEKLEGFMRNLMPMPGQLAKIQHAFTGLFKVVKAIIGIFGRLIHAINPNLNVMDKLGDNFYDFIDAIGNGLEKVAKFIEESEILNTIIEGLGHGISTAADFIGNGFSTIYNYFKTFDFGKLGNDIAKTFDGLAQSIYDAMPDWLQGYLDRIHEIFGWLIDDISILDFSAVQEDFYSLGEVFRDFGETVLKLEELKDKIVKFFDFSDVNSGINNIIGQGDKFVEWYKEHIAPLFSNKDIAATAGAGGMLWILIEVGKVLGGLANIMKGGGATLTEIPKTLKSVRKALDSYTNGVNTENIKNVAKAIGILAGSIFLLAMIKPERLYPAAIALAAIGFVLLVAMQPWKKVAPQVTTMETVLNTLATGIKNGIANLTKALKIREIRKAVLDFGITIAIIIGAIFAVMKMMEDPKFMDALKVVGGIAATIIGIIVIFSLIGQFLSKGMKSFGMVSIGMFAISLAILAIIGAMTMLFNMKLPDDYKKKIAILGGVLLAVAGLVVVLAFANKIAGNISRFKIGKGGLSSYKSGGLRGLPIISAILLLMATVYALKTLFDIKLPDDWKAKMGILILIFGMMSALILVIGAASKLAGGKGLKAASTIIALCIMIGVILAALKVLENIRPKALLKGVLALAAILIALGVALAGAGSIKGIGAAGTVLAMCLLVAVMVGALSYLSLLSNESLLKGAIGLAGILIVLSIAFSAAGKIQNEGSWKTVLAMVAMVAVIAISLGVLENQNWKGLLAAAVSMGIVLLALSKVFDSIGEMDGENIKDKLEAFGVGLLAIGVIAAILFTLSIQPWSGMLAAGAAIAAVLYTYGKAFSMVAGIEDLDWKKTGMFIAGAFACVLIGAALWIAAQQNWKQIAAAGGAISACLLAIAEAFKIMNSIPFDQTKMGMSIAALLVGAIACILIGAALSLAAQYDWQNLLGAAGAIGICLLAIAVTMAIMTAVGSVAAAGVVPAAGMVLEGLGALWGVTEALSKLATYNPENLVGAAISIAIALLAMAVTMAICAAVGTLGVAALIGIGVLDIFIADIAAVLWALSELADIDVLKDGGDKLAVIGEAIGKFIGSIYGGLAEGALTGVGNGIANIGKSLSDFMTNAEGFFEGLKGMDPNMVSAAQTLVGVVLALTAAEFLDGIKLLIAPFSGFSSLGGFGEKLTQFGSGIVSFYEATKEIKNPYAFKAVAEGAKYIIDMTKELPNSGGLAGLFAGENDADVWGAQVFSMARSLKNIAFMVTGVDFGGIEPLTDVMGLLIEKCNDIGNSGGKWGEFWGNNDPDEWGSQVYSMARSLKNIALMITGVEFGGIEPMAEAMGILIEKCNDIGNSGGVVGFWLGNNDPDEWGSQVYSMARSLKNIALMVTGVDFTGLTPMIEALGSLIEATNNLDPTSGIFSSSEYMANWCDNVKLVGAALYTFYLHSVNIDADKISQIGVALQEIVKALTLITGGKVDGTKVKSFASALEDLATTGIDGFAQNITNGAEQVTTAINAFVEVILAAIDAYTDTFQQLGKKQAEAYLKGIRSMYGEAETVGKMLGMKVWSALELQIKNFEQIGTMCAKGFANGMVNEDALKAVARAAASLGESAITSTKNAVQSKSPAKKFIEIGEYCGEGFAIGMQNWAHSVSKAGETLGESAKSGLELALENLNNHVDNVLDTNPVITPIVDLSYVTSAAGQINSMFNSALYRTSNGTTYASSAIAAGRITNNGEEIQNGQNSRFGNNYTFVQNNNSPKALSRLDIYRDTRSLLKQVEGV